MKYLIERSLQNGNTVSLSLLKERFIGNRSMNELMVKYGVCMRTCYRYLVRGLSDFAREMEKLGYDKKKIMCEYGNEPLFLTMLDRVIKEDDEEARKEEGRSREIGKPTLSVNPRHYCFCSFSSGERARRG